jgi:hypothetical protein
MPNSLLIDLHYLPSLEYFSLLKQHPNLILEANEHFTKQTYRNRCYVLGANKIEPLVVPIQKEAPKMLMRDVKIDYNENWDKIHWRTIEAAYRKAPFFEFYSDYFSRIYEKKPIFLWDFNFELLSICLKFLKLNLTISLTEKYEKEVENSIFDARSVINPKISYKNNNFYSPKPYQQNFGNEFEPNLSIIDLLFCKGNLASANI